MVLRSAQPLREISTRIISCGVKAGRCVGLTLPPSCADYLEILEASTSWNRQRLYRDCFIYTFKRNCAELRTGKSASGEGLLQSG